MESSILKLNYYKIMENKTVKIICGDYPENFEKLEILSDANFVFENDPEYNTVPQ